jgi:hypothetical protein
VALEVLNFSFNLVDNQNSLRYCSQDMPNLKQLIVTGNPFSITGELNNYSILEQLLNQKGCQLVNETLN